MIYSMTGYGKAEKQVANNKKLVVEVRSLNSKSLDLNVRIAPQLRSKELEIRTLIGQRLERGKIDLSIYYQDAALDDTPSYTPINREAFAYYYKELITLQQELGWANNQDVVGAILRMPDVTKVQETNEINDEDWTVVLQAIEETISQFNAFRQQEGASLQTMFNEKLDAIASLLVQVEPYEQTRVEKIKARIEANLEQLSTATQQAVDHNRLEQEMIFYLEKLDITEEKVRLTNHIKYFRETMACEGAGVGKKLGFIAQEMGREINTLGSKSNQSEMQIIVVQMKDVLEQIKEQVLNVL
ncbi:MAG: YicC family protein [Paludibacteraceae bacterium]|nr:YicC family protein [Paludibacteraceae bacterium]